MDISIIIATYRRSGVLKRTLTSMNLLNVDSLNWEILIIDNAQDKLTQECVQQFEQSLPIKYIRSLTRGKSCALNLAIGLAQGELFVFTDDDVIADQYWLKELLNGSKRYPQNVSFGGRILPENEKNIPEHFKQLKTYHLDFAIADWRLPEGPYSSQQVFGPNFAIRRNVFRNGYRFNESLGGGALYPFGEDTRFLESLEKDGMPPIYLPKALVFHQLRDEQKSLSWLYQRAFNAGCGDVYERKNSQVVTVLGIPRYLIKQLIQQFILSLKLILSNNDVLKIECRYQLSRLQGQIYQFWKIRNDKSSP